MRIHLEREKKSLVKKLTKTYTVLQLLHDLKINPETVLVVREGTVLHDTDKLADKDELTVMSVISGG